MMIIPRPINKADLVNFIANLFTNTLNRDRDNAFALLIKFYCFVSVLCVRCGPMLWFLLIFLPKNEAACSYPLLQVLDEDARPQRLLEVLSTAFAWNHFSLHLMQLWQPCTNRCQW